VTVAVALSPGVLDFPADVVREIRAAEVDGFAVTREHRRDGAAVATIHGDVGPEVRQSLADDGWSVRGDQCQWIERPGVWPPVALAWTSPRSESPRPDLAAADILTIATSQPREVAEFAEQIPKYQGKPGALPPEPPEPDSEGTPAPAVTSPSVTVPVRRWRPLQPVSMNHRKWRAECTAELYALGAWKRAEKFSVCGSMAYAATCPHQGCRASPARIQVIADCDLRICPNCAKRNALEASGKVDEAIEHAERLQRELAPDVARKFREQWERAVRRRDRLAAKVKRLERENEDSPYTLEQADKLAKLRTRTNSLRESWRHARDESRWTWKCATVGVQYDPYDVANYTVEGLRFRAKRAMVAAGAAVDALRVTRLEAFTVGGECSDGGHVHAHILYRGPAVHWKAARAAVMNALAAGDCRKDRPAIKASVWLKQVEPRAGYHGDNGEAKRQWEYLNATLPGVRKQLAKAVRAGDGDTTARLSRRVARMSKEHIALLRGAITESVKYTIKAPSPLRCEWIAGANETVINPKLAARWEVATHRMQLRRHYGIMRRALAIVNAEREEVDATKAGGERVEHCHDCGAELPPTSDRTCWRPWRTFKLARAVADRERWRGLVTIYRPPSTYAPVAVRPFQLPPSNDGDELDGE